MNLAEAMKELESAGSEKIRKMNTKNGATGEQFGCYMKDIRAIAKKIKMNTELGLELFKSGNLDARFLSSLIIKPKDLSAEQLQNMLSEITFSHLAGYFIDYVIKKHSEKEQLRKAWMKSTHPMLARGGWSLTTERVCKEPDGLDLSHLLDRIDKEMPIAHEWTQWTMNYCLAEIGIRYPEHRQRALEIGEKHGVYRDYPVSKGCTSPFAPMWINEMVSRSN